MISVTNSSGTLLAINDYDEFGVPGSGNLGAWGYTGQAWLPGIGVWHYKARAYDPELGRFLQTDPIGYAGGLNLYAYVLNDPVNFTDPLGLQDDGGDDGDPPRRPPVICTGTRLPNACPGGGPAPWLNPSSSLPLAGIGGATGSFGGLSSGHFEWQGGSVINTADEIIVTGGRLVWVPGFGTVQFSLAQRIMPRGPLLNFFARPPAWWPRPPGWTKDWVFRPGEGVTHITTTFSSDSTSRTF